MSIVTTNSGARMMFGMATTVLGRRLYKVREAAGYGDRGRAAEFARLIGISPPSLHDLESGKTKSMAKSLLGYIRIGANPHFLDNGRGAPMIKDIAKNVRVHALMSRVVELEDSEIDTVETIVAAFLSAKSRDGPDGGDGLNPMELN